MITRWVIALLCSLSLNSPPKPKKAKQNIGSDSESELSDAPEINGDAQPQTQVKQEASQSPIKNPADTTETTNNTNDAKDASKKDKDEDTHMHESNEPKEPKSESESDAPKKATNKSNKDDDDEFGDKPKPKKSRSELSSIT